MFHISDLDKTNQYVNAHVAGDCKASAFAKRKLLLEAGWPEDTLHIALVRDENNRWHAILLVDFKGDEIALDNRFNWTEKLSVLERYGYRMSYILPPQEGGDGT